MENRHRNSCIWSKHWYIWGGYQVLRRLASWFSCWHTSCVAALYNQGGHATSINTIQLLMYLASRTKLVSAECWCEWLVYLCVSATQVLWHSVKLNLALVLAQSPWILFSVLGQKPLCWTVDVSLPWASPLVTTPGMLVWDVLVSLVLHDLGNLQSSSIIVNLAI